MKHLTLFLLAATGLCLAADELPKVYEHDVTLWKEVAVPPLSSHDEFERFMQRANLSVIDWEVERSGKSVHASLGEGVRKTPAADRPAFAMEIPVGHKPSVTPTYVLKVSDGWLAGYNQGEFGAALWWFSTNGKQRYKISDHQVNQFVVHKGRIFAAEGLDHGISFGSMIEINKTAGKWTATTFIDLKSGCYAVAILPDNRFCLITMDKLLAVSLDKAKEELIPYADWGGLYPNSLAVDAKSENIYIGMRQFVASYNLKANDHTFRFLIPSLDFLNKAAPSF